MQGAHLSPPNGEPAALSDSARRFDFFDRNHALPVHSEQGSPSQVVNERIIELHGHAQARPPPGGAALNDLRLLVRDHPTQMPTARLFRPLLRLPDEDLIEAEVLVPRS